MIDHEAHVDSVGPSILFFLVVEPRVEFGKLALVEISFGNGNAIDVAAGRIERVISQRPPQVDTGEIPVEYRGQIGSHRV
jgi:hypothetical protein